MAFFFIALLYVVAYIKKSSKNDFSTTSYKKKAYFLTKAESEFYKKLLDLYEGKYIIIPQVNLDKLFFSNYKERSRIDRKSVDFVFLDKIYFSPLMAIELDDHTHDRIDRVERDKKVNQLFVDNNFPLLRMNPNSDIRADVDRVLPESSYGNSTVSVSSELGK